MRVRGFFSRLSGASRAYSRRRQDRAPHDVCGCSRAKRELGFQAGPVAAALERAVRWYEANGYIAKTAPSAWSRGRQGFVVPSFRPVSLFCIVALEGGI